MSSYSNDTKSNERARSFMSFLIFFFVLLLGAAVCAKSLFLNPENIKKSFLNFNYVCSFADNINDYADDVFTRNGLSTDSVDEVLSYDFCYQLTDEYIGANLGNNSSYVETTAQSTIDEKRKDIKALIKAEVKSSSQKYNDNKADAIADNICKYISGELNIKGMDKLKTLLSLGKVVSLVGVAVAGVFTAVFCLITFFIGAKRYRSVRAVSIAFLSAGLTNLVLSLMAVIVFKLKSVDIFPVYLQNAFMDYVNGCIQGFALCGAGFIIFSLVLCTVVWKMKRKGK